VGVTLSVGSLLPKTNYHYRIVATNWGNYGGVTLGGDLVLTTLAGLPPAPTIGVCRMLGNGWFHLQFSGQSGATYTVLCSSNLVEWGTAGIATESSAGAFEFADTNAPQHARCFYRLRSP
jgi:hypothetical protein